MFDGLDYFAVWTRPSGRNGIVAGAVIGRAGVVLDMLAIAEGLFPSIALGNGGQKFLAFNCYTDNAEGRPYRTDRVWGLVNPFGGVTENCRQGPDQGVGVLVFPNPAHSCFFVRSYQTITRLAVYDAAGRRIRIGRPADKAGSNEMKIATGNMAAGIYFLELGTGTRSVRTKLVVE